MPARIKKLFKYCQEGPQCSTWNIGAPLGGLGKGDIVLKGLKARRSFAKGRQGFWGKRKKEGMPGSIRARIDGPLPQKFRRAGR